MSPLPFQTLHLEGATDRHRELLHSSDWYFVSILCAPHSTPGTEDSGENRIDKATEVSLKLTWQDERDKSNQLFHRLIMSYKENKGDD